MEWTLQVRYWIVANHGLLMARTVQPYSGRNEIKHVKSKFGQPFPKDAADSTSKNGKH